MTAHVLISRHDSVLLVTLARPAKKNALTSAMYEALIVALHIADRDAAIGAIVITGSGGAFSAGNDIADFLTRDRSFDNSPAHRFIKTIAMCDTPLVAAVEGVAIGVGTTLCLHCDLVYAAPSAMFRMPFVDLGLVPEAGSSLLVPQRVGLARATELLMLGEPCGAEDAARLGLINAVVPAVELIAHAMERAASLAARPRSAIAATRRLIRGDRSALIARIEEESRAFDAALQSKEAHDALTKFIGKAKA